MWFQDHEEWSMSPGFKCGVQLAWHVARKKLLFKLSQIHCSCLVNYPLCTLVVMFQLYTAYHGWLFFRVERESLSERITEYCLIIYVYIAHFATRVPQLKIRHFWVIGIERNVCRCTFNRYSVCGLVVRVSGYRYRGPGFDSRRYQIFWVVVGLERGPLSLVRPTEELLE